MKDSFKAVRVSEHVYWVGAVDWSVRDFHGYLTGSGTTYNAYLIMADKITLVDTVKAPFKKELLARISSIVEPSRIDYIVSNHSEMDHSGCLPEIIQAVQPEKVFASVNGVKTLGLHFHEIAQHLTAVKEGDSISLGNLDLAFVETKMVHWPDSMFSYLPADELLFSQDGFGMHLASGERFADEINPVVLEHEATKYYANILMPLSGMIGKTLDRVLKMELPLKVVAPDHGPIWRRDSDIAHIVGSYIKWAEQRPGKKAVIVYDTMWHSTNLMAQAITEGVAAGGAAVKLMKMRSDHRSNVATELLDAGALLIGSPTINNSLFPTIGDITTYLKGLKPKNKIGAAFGSYGWSGEAVTQLNEILTAMQVKLVHDGLKANYVPSDDDLRQCYELGQTVAAELSKL